MAKERGMTRSSSAAWILIIHLLSMGVVSRSSHHSQGHQTIGRSESPNDAVGRRVLLSFRETPKGSNATFDCSISGPCVPCQYSEKNDVKYRCSETGYRIPLKCVEIEDGSKKGKSQKSPNSRSALENSYKKIKPHVMQNEAEKLYASIRHRSLLEDSSTLEDGLKAYITYRSCIPPVNEEKLSVLGFEGIMVCLLLVSGSAVYFRRKRSVAMPGAGPVRIPTSFRF